MHHLPTPSDENGVHLEAREVFKLCISTVQNRTLRARLISIEGAVEDAASKYDAAASTTQLHLLPRTSDVGGVVSKAEMVNVYTQKMVPATQPGRPIYNRIISAPPLGRCPLCDVGFVSTLDHHLPKTEYPVLAVTPNNLVPSCSWCQRAKAEAYPDTIEHQTLHPYFDDFEDEIWLYANIVEESPASFVFYVDPPSHWPQTKAERLRYHLRTFQLQKLYVSNAGSHLIDIRQSLTELLRSGGPSDVRKHLEREARSRLAVHPNSWGSAMYRAAANSDWFCSGGFAR